MADDYDDESFGASGFEDGYGTGKRKRADKVLAGRYPKRYTIFNSFYNTLLTVAFLVIILAPFISAMFPELSVIADFVRWGADLILYFLVIWLVTVWYFLQRGYWAIYGTVGLFPIESFEPHDIYIAEHTAPVRTKVLDKKSNKFKMVMKHKVIQQLRAYGVNGAVKDLPLYDGGKAWGFWDCLLARREKGTADKRFDKMKEMSQLGFKLKAGERRGCLLDFNMDLSVKNYKTCKWETLQAISSHPRFRLDSPIYQLDDPRPSIHHPSSKPSDYETELNDARNKLWQTRKDNDNLAKAYAKLCRKFSVSVPRDIQVRMEEG